MKNDTIQSLIFDHDHVEGTVETWSHKELQMITKNTLIRTRTTNYCTRNIFNLCILDLWIWKLTRELQNILGHMGKSITHKDDDSHISLWWLNKMTSPEDMEPYSCEACDISIVGKCKVASNTPSLPNTWVWSENQ